MIRRLLPVLFLLCASSAVSRCEELPPSAPTGSLPPAIRAKLSEEYPGWKLAPVAIEIQKEFRKHDANRLPSLVSADFDHDGKKDYAVQIALTTPGAEEQIIIIFLARDSDYEENIVQSMGIDPTVYLWVSNTVISETGDDGQDKMISKAVLRVLGGPIGDTAYGFQDKRFQEIHLQEDPDHPDPTIPRPAESHGG